MKIPVLLINLVLNDKTNHANIETSITALAVWNPSINPPGSHLERGGGGQREREREGERERESERDRKREREREKDREVIYSSRSILTRSSYSGWKALSSSSRSKTGSSSMQPCTLRPLK